MKKFILKCALFSIPIVGLFVFPFTVYLLSDEFLSVPAVVRLQQSGDKEVLYDSAFTSETSAPYKILVITQTDPEVLALGLSRTLTIRSIFFKDPGVFYNAGNAVHIAPDLVTFMNRTASDTRLRVILFDASNLLLDTFSDPVPEQSSAYDAFHQFLVSGWRQVYIDYLAKGFSLEDFFQANNASTSYIGLAALRDHSGSRRDGSLDWGDDALLEKIRKDIPFQIAGAVSNTTLKNEPRLSEQNLAAIEQFLAICKQRGIYIIGYVSPYASEIYQAEQSLNDSAGIYKTEPTILAAALNKYGYPFYDLRDLAITGSSDAELYNDLHPSEKGTLKLLVYIADHEPKLDDYLDVRSLESKIDKEPF